MGVERTGDSSSKKIPEDKGHHPTPPIEQEKELFESRVQAADKNAVDALFHYNPEQRLRVSSGPTIQADPDLPRMTAPGDTPKAYRGLPSTVLAYQKGRKVFVDTDHEEGRNLSAALNLLKLLSADWTGREGADEFIQAASLLSSSLKRGAPFDAAKALPDESGLWASLRQLYPQSQFNPQEVRTMVMGLSAQKLDWNQMEVVSVDDQEIDALLSSLRAFVQKMPRQAPTAAQRFAYTERKAEADRPEMEPPKDLKEKKEELEKEERRLGVIIPKGLTDEQINQERLLRRKEQQDLAARQSSAAERDADYWREQQRKRKIGSKEGEKDKGLENPPPPASPSN